MKKIISNILHRFKEDSLAKRTESGDREVVYKSLADIRSCLLVYVAGEEPSAAMELLKEKMPGVRFGRLCFVPSGVEISETAGTVTFRNEELGFGGKIQNELLHKELSVEYDLLVDLTTVGNVMIQYVLTHSKAHCIVGMKREAAIGDIIVNGVENFEEFADKMTALLVEINRYEHETV